MENKKLLSFDGVIGRRGFIINYLFISIIVSVVSMIINLSLLAFAPHFFNQSLQVVTNTVSIFLLYPTLERRIKDIFGNTERDMNFYLLMIMTVIGLCVPLVNFFVIIALMVAEGKITGKMPRSELIRFNWGAFLGTWIWGLFNKSYKTLWMIPLAITPAALPFSLICGLKGNEWAYKNKASESLDKFHESQKVQAVIWSVLYPVLCIILTISLAIGTGMFIKNIEKQHPGLVKVKVEKVFKGFIKSVSASLYTSYEKTDDGYKFYIEPKSWTKLSEKDRTTYYILALYNVMFDEGKGIDTKDSLSSLVNTTKIYSSFNNELLCECVVPENVTVTVPNMTEIIQKYIKQNNSPSTP